MKEALNDPIFQIQLQKYNKDKLLIWKLYIYI
jgi:hypothetical protein